LFHEPGPKRRRQRDPRFDNQPPLGERIAMEFEEELRREGLIERAQELAAAAARAPACDSKENCGKIGDFVKQCRNFEKALEAVREKHNRPLIDARTQLKARTDAIFLPISDAVKKLRQQLDAYMRAETARVERERREAEDEARAAPRRAGKARAAGPAKPSMPSRSRREVEAPVARGDYGSRVGTRTVWCHEIESVRQLPDRLLKHPKRDRSARQGDCRRDQGRVGQVRDRGVRIWSDQQAAVR
jgi:hypothetical protein